MLEQAVILAGGAGTRLRPLVSDVPKPLAAIAGRPFIEYLLMQVRAHDIRQVVVCAGYRAEALMAHLGDGRRWDIEVVFSVEETPLGTGGALSRALPHISGDRCLVMNGDSFFDIPIGELYTAHVQAGSAITIALARAERSSRFGSVAIDPNGNVTEFLEKSSVPGPALINAGLYIIERRELASIPAGKPVSLEREIMPAMIGHGLRGVVFDAYFVDIGVPEDFIKAQQHTATWKRIAGAGPDDAS
jgi:NDP-sugar pyrophosphorylase family protein